MTTQQPVTETNSTKTATKTISKLPKSKGKQNTKNQSPLIASFANCLKSNKSTKLYGSIYLLCLKNAHAHPCADDHTWTLACCNVKGNSTNA